MTTPAPRYSVRWTVELYGPDEEGETVTLATATGDSPQSAALQLEMFTDAIVQATRRHTRALNDATIRATTDVLHPPDAA